MSTSYIMPDPRAITKLLELILGTGVAVAKQGNTDLGGDIVATFINDDDQVVAACTCDRNFVGYAGGALSMIPPDVVNESIAANKLSDALRENFHEVMNICSKLMMSDSSAHLRLDRTLPADQAAPLVAGLGDGAACAGFAVDVPRYGKGNVSFHIT